MVQINAYTDDVVIITWNLKASEEALQKLDHTAQEIGLIIGQGKKKIRRHNHCKQIAVVGYRFERVSCFPYVSWIINYGNSISEEITHRIEKGNRACYAYKGLITSKLINKYTKWKMYLHDIDRASSDLLMWNLDIVCTEHKSNISFWKTILKEDIWIISLSGRMEMRSNNELRKLIKGEVIVKYTGCHRRNGPNFRRVFLMLNYTDITQNTYVPSWTVIEIMAK